MHHSTFLHSLASGNIYNNGFSHLISFPDGAETRHLTVRRLLALPGSLLRYLLCQLQMRTPAYPRLPNPPPGSDRTRRPQVASVPVADLKVNHRLTLSHRFPLCLEQHWLQCLCLCVCVGMEDNSSTIKEQKMPFWLVMLVNTLPRCFNITVCHLEGWKKFFCFQFVLRVLTSLITLSDLFFFVGNIWEPCSLA